MGAEGRKEEGPRNARRTRAPSKARSGISGEEGARGKIADADRPREAESSGAKGRPLPRPEAACLPQAEDGPDSGALEMVSLVKEDAMPDMVNHPPHYTAHPSGIECIQITEHMDFLTGNTFKYLWRAGYKAGNSKLEDLEKAKWYLERAIAKERAKNAAD